MQPGSGESIKPAKFRSYHLVGLLSVLSLLVLIVGGLLAYHLVFQRAGEAAVALIPSDADDLVFIKPHVHAA